MLAERVYQLLRTVPRGRVTTYGEIARALGTRGYRAIGSILRRNPNAPKVPCHRVVKSDGSLGGYVAGVERKAQLLRAEGVEVGSGKIQDFSRKLVKLTQASRS
jgi:methylated-DNA-[protein]-cysteine S-methyltransferase